MATAALLTSAVFFWVCRNLISLLSHNRPRTALKWVYRSSFGTFGTVTGQQTIRLLFTNDVASHNLRTITEYATYRWWSADGTYVVFRTPYFFPGRIENPGVDRWFVSTDKIEKIAADPAFRLNGVDGVWSGQTPDGSLLLLRDLSTSDLYALDVDLP